MAQLSVSVTLYDLADSTHNTWEVRDIWNHSDLGVASGSLQVDVPPHGVRFLRMKPRQPPLRPPCPADFAPHTGGYWHNLAVQGKAPEDGTIDECAALCRNSTDGCVAFEVFVGSGYPGQCYNFMHTLEAPFTPAQSVTCTKKAE